MPAKPRITQTFITLITYYQSVRLTAEKKCITPIESMFVQNDKLPSSKCISNFEIKFWIHLSASYFDQFLYVVI